MANFDDMDDFDRAASAFPALDDDLGGFSTPAPLAAPVASSLPRASLDFDFDNVPTPPPVKITGDDEIEKFESQFPDIGTPQPPPPQQPTFRTTSAYGLAPVSQSQSYPPPITHAFEEEEPDVIKEWRAKQAQEIKLRDEASARKQEETVERANQSIDDFYLDHKRRVEASIKGNKIREEEFLAEMTDALASGTTWTRICQLIELDNSQSKTLARAGPGTTDLTRFKEVLLRLRREGDMAPGAGGY